METPGEVYGNWDNLEKGHSTDIYMYIYVYWHIYIHIYQRTSTLKETFQKGLYEIM